MFSPVRVGHGMTPEARLGQLLFFDRELSGNRNIACATCHLPEQHAADDRHIAVGQNETPLFRNTIEPFNRAFATSLFWDGRVEMIDGVVHAPVPVPVEADTLLVAQALLPMLDRHEMRGRPGDVAADGRVNELALIDDADVEAVWSAIMTRLLALPGYITAFFEAYPTVAISELNIVHVARAIVAFEQHLWELTDTPFDRYLGSPGLPADDLALLGAAYDGAILFFGDAGCYRCHSGPLLSDGEYHNIAVPQVGPGADGTGLDLGRAAVTGRASDRFAFRTPPLRNVALTGPYMHDGAFFTLDEVIRHHADPAASLRAFDGGFLPTELAEQIHREHDEARIAALDPDVRPLRPLSDTDIANLEAFLGALTSTVEQTVFSGAGVPFEVPSGLPIDGGGRGF